MKMALGKNLDNIVNSKSKIAIIRLFVSKTTDFKATGREIARLVKFSPPATHAALKELFELGILELENIGRQHIYSLDGRNRMVQKILKPAFEKEGGLVEEIKSFLVKQIKEQKLAKKIISVILYGSVQRKEAGDKSDVDIAVIVKNKENPEKIEREFLNEIADKFYNYFKMHLHPYVKTKEEFHKRLKKNLPPVSALIKSYSVLYGHEPLEI